MGSDTWREAGRDDDTTRRPAVGSRRAGSTDQQVQRSLRVGTDRDADTTAARAVTAARRSDDVPLRFAAAPPTRIQRSPVAGAMPAAATGTTRIQRAGADAPATELDRQQFDIELSLFDLSLASCMEPLIALGAAAAMPPVGPGSGAHVAQVIAMRSTAIAMVRAAHDRYTSVDARWNKLRSFATQREMLPHADLFENTMKRLGSRFLAWEMMLQSVNSGNVAIPHTILGEIAGTHQLAVSCGRNAARTVRVPPLPPPPPDWDEDGGDDFFLGLREAATADDG